MLTWLSDVDSERDVNCTYFYSRGLSFVSYETSRYLSIQIRRIFSQSHWLYSFEHQHVETEHHRVFMRKHQFFKAP